MCSIHHRANTHCHLDANQVCNSNFQWVWSLTFEPRILGELPPSPPRACFGRKQLIKKIIDLAENVTPIALIGAGGIGKTSVSLAVLHHDRIKARFGDNRRFIRCDQFPASCTHFLARLSQAVGAGIDNPKDLMTLRQSLSSKEMLIVLDNAESILDPQGADGQEIYDVVEELSQFSNVCLVITSRITTIPPNCETLKVPTLSTGATHDTFYHIYKYGERSGQVNDILKQLDFHPLSVALLATVAHQNQWDNDRLAREWKRRRTDVLRTEHQTSLAATIELSLASPLFRALGPDARGLLEVVAFYPQGVNENNLNWFFPTIPNVTHIFDKLCILSLIYRSNGFITMLAPLRDYLRPNDPKLSPLICTTKERYFVRLAVEFDPNRPEFKDTQWFVTEDVNVEHLLDIFTFIDPDSDGVWDACIDFMRHLDWYKPRQTVLRPKIEALPDNHPSKPGCLSEVALLLGSVGNYAEGIRLLNHALKIERERKNHHRVALILESLSHANRMLGLRIKGIHQAKEASEIYERLGKTAERARCLDQLARLLHDDGYLDAAEEAAVHSTKLLPEKGHEFKVCLSHCTLGDIYCSKGQREKAIHHYEVVLLIASSFNWHGHLFWTHFSLAELFFDELAFDDARAHVEKAGSHALNDLYLLGRAAYLQASILHRQHRFKDATFEVLHALEIFEKVGSLKELEACRALCQDIERGPPFGEPPETAFCSTSVDSPFSAHDTLS